MADDTADAALELTILSLDVLKHSTAFPFSKSKLFAVAWIDPRLKSSTKLQSLMLHLPLSRHTLQDPNSRVTIQVLSRIVLRGTKFLGSATVPLSSIRIAGDALALQLRTPSGGFAGSIRVSARVMWCLGNGFPGEEESVGCVTGVPAAAGVSVEPERCDFLSVVPTAPPMPLMAPDISQPLPMPPVVEGVGDGERRWRSFLVGLVSGAAAALLVGVAALAEG